MKWIVFVFMSLFMIYLVSGLTITEFNNSLGAENMSFIGDSNNTRYLAIPTNISYVTSGSLTVNTPLLWEDEGIFADVNNRGYDHGLGFNGSNFYLEDGSNPNQVIYELNISGQETGTSWDYEVIAGASVSLRAFTFNDDQTELVCSDFNPNVERINIPAGTSAGSFATTGVNADPEGVDFDGTNYYVMDGDDETLYQYTSGGAYTGTSYDVSANLTASGSAYVTEGDNYLFVFGRGIGSNFLRVNKSDGVVLDILSSPVANGGGLEYYHGDGSIYYYDEGGRTVRTLSYMDNIVNNPFLETGTSDGSYEWNQSGNMSFLSDVVITDVLDEINSYLQTCTPVGDYCNVPFVFHSDDNGSLQYLGLSFSNEGFDENSQTFDDPVLEASTQDFEINISYDNATYTSVSGILTYNGTQYIGSGSGSGTNRVFSATLDVPEVTSQQNHSFYWTITMTGLETFVGNSSFNNQSVNPIDLDDCSVHTTLVYNFTVRDEEDRSILAGGLDNVTTEVELLISPLGEIDPFLNFSQTYSFTNPATICANVDLNSTFRVDLVASYISLDRVQEFYYIDNGTISNNTIPQHIDLHDLLLTDSTTFLFNFLDENGLDPENAMIHTERKYIGDGVFREVERSKEDDNGETHVHLVQEDVIYRFRVTQNGNELFLSSEFNAKCLSTPCEITLSAEEDVTEYEDDFDNLPEGTFGISVNKVSRQVTLIFNLNQSRTMNLTVFEFNNLVDDEAIVSNTLTAFSGSVAVTVPQSFGNTTFYAVVYKDDEFVDSVWIDLTPEAKDFFPNGLGLILTALMVLVLALMGAGQGVMIIIMTIIALIVASLIFLLDLDMVALMGIISAGAILVWKLVKGRNSG